jgi:hypothetical protein
MYGLFITGALALAAPAAGPPQDAAWVVYVGLTGDEVRQRTNQMRSRGYRPTSINAYNAAEANRFTVVYRKSAGPAWAMDWGLTPAQLLQRGRELRGKGYSPVCLSGCNRLGAERLADLWLKEKGEREATYGLTAAQLLRQAGQYRDRGFRPVGISSYRIDAANAYAVVWEKGGPAWEVKYGLSGPELQQVLTDLSARGYRPTSIGGINDGSVVRYSAVWEKRKGPAWQVRYGQTKEGFLEGARAMAALGYAPKTVVGYNTLQGDRFTSVWEKETR